MPTPHPILTPAPSTTSVPLPKEKTLQKRPLLHPPIPGPSSIAPRVVYISASTPRAGAISRVDKYLDALEAPVGGLPGKQRRRNGVKKQGQQQEGVILKASGKAVQNALMVGMFFMARGNEVRVKTGSMKIVDDVVDLPEGALHKAKPVKKGKAGGERKTEADRENKEVGKGEAVKLGKKRKAEEDQEDNKAVEGEAVKVGKRRKAEKDQEDNEAVEGKAVKVGKRREAEEGQGDKEAGKDETVRVGDKEAGQGETMKVGKKRKAEEGQEDNEAVEGEAVGVEDKKTGQGEAVKAGEMDVDMEEQDEVEMVKRTSSTIEILILRKQEAK